MHTIIITRIPAWNGSRETAMVPRVKHAQHAPLAELSGP